MTTHHDDATVRRYRDANAALDERPSAATRAAILAAAARQVNAKPQAADARGPARRRWPLAAAAAVLLSSLAVMLASRTEQEMPSFTAPAEPAAVAPAPPSAADTESTSGNGATPDSQASKARDGAAVARDNGANGLAASSEAPARAKKAAPPIASEPMRPQAPAEVARAPQADASNEVLSKQSAVGATDTPRESRQAFPAAPAATLPAPPPAPPAVARSAPPPASAPAAAGAVVPGRIDEAAKPEASMNAERAARRESALPQGAARQDATREFERSAQQWLEHIVKLRGAGRDADADAELKRFRERYPEIQIPPTALPPLGQAPGTR